ncbi:MAG: hypothetical protein KDK76_02250 [Chlamydiia bacterium]|nr:hypothetical protein [Chlamydiia bacterium]
MDAIVRYFSSDQSIAGDLIYLLQDPRAQQEYDDGIQNVILQFFAPGALPDQEGENSPALEKLKNVIDLTEFFSENGAKAFGCFTLLNVALYHFTRLLSFVALTYFVTSVIFLVITYDVDKIANASRDLKDILEHSLNIPKINGEQLAQLQLDEERKNAFDTLHREIITLNNVRLTIAKLENLKGDLFLMGYVLQYPIERPLVHLRALEAKLSAKLYPA